MRHNNENVNVNAEDKPEMKKKCGCDENCTCDCDCGCGAHCGCHCGCHEHCGCGAHCGCGSHCGGKFLLLLLLVFLAGVGFNELLHGGFKCKAKCDKHAMMAKAPMPHFTDGAGTVVIVNTAKGGADVMHYLNPNGKNMHHKHHKHMKMKNMPHHNANGAENTTPDNIPAAESAK